MNHFLNRDGRGEPGPNGGSPDRPPDLGNLTNPGTQAERNDGAEADPAEQLYCACVDALEREDYPEAKAIAERIVAAARTEGDAELQIQGLRLLAAAETALEELDQAKEGRLEALRIAQSLGDHELLAELQYELADCLEHRGELDAALTAFKESRLELLQIREPGPEARENLAQVCSIIGDFHCKRNEFEQASGSFKESLELLQSLNGTAEGYLLQTLERSAWCEECREMYAEAEDGYKRALNLLERLNPGDAKGRLRLYSHISDCLVNQSKLAEARKFCEEGLRQVEQAPAGLVEQERGFLLGSLGLVCCGEKKYRDAGAHLERAAELESRQEKPNLSYLRMLYNLLSACSMANKEKESAGDWLRWALDTAKREEPDGGPVTLEQLQILKKHYGERHLYEQEEALCLQIIQLSLNLGGENSLLHARSIYEYASFLRSVSQAGKSLQLCQQSEVMAEAISDAALLRANILVLRALLASDEEDYESAISLFNSVIALPYVEGMEEILPFAHYYLSDCYLSCEMFSKAEEEFELSLEAASRVFEKDGTDYAFISKQGAVIAAEKGDFERAADMIEKTIDIHRRANESDPVGLARLLEDAADIYQELYQGAQSVQVLVKVMDFLVEADLIWEEEGGEPQEALERAESIATISEYLEGLGIHGAEEQERISACACEYRNKVQNRRETAGLP